MLEAQEELDGNKQIDPTKTRLELCAEQLQPLTYDVQCLTELTTIASRFNIKRPITMQQCYRSMMESIFQVVDGMNAIKQSSKEFRIGSQVVSDNHNAAWAIRAIGGALFEAVPEQFMLAASLTLEVMELEGEVPAEMKRVFGSGDQQLEIADVRSFKALRLKLFGEALMAISEQGDYFPSYAASLMKNLSNGRDPTLISVAVDFDAKLLSYQERSFRQFM